MLAAPPMKTPPLKLAAGVCLLAACTVPLSAGRNAGSREGAMREPKAHDGINVGHKRSDAEKDARQIDKDLRKNEANEKRRAELMKRFDKNQDGKLDDTEKAALEAALKKQEKKRDGK